jgi:nucleoid DNA-binding protein
LSGAYAVTKRDIVNKVAWDADLTLLKVGEVVQRTFDEIIETLVRDGRIELRNFGVFKVRKRAARAARNPRTGERVDVAEKHIVTFKPGKAMKKRIEALHGVTNDHDEIENE